MKKLILLFGIGLIGFSCKKTYTCDQHVNFNNGGWFVSGSQPFVGTKQEMKQYEKESHDTIVTEYMGQTITSESKMVCYK